MATDADILEALLCMGSPTTEHEWLPTMTVISARPHHRVCRWCGRREDSGDGRDWRKWRI